MFYDTTITTIVVRAEPIGRPPRIRRQQSFLEPGV